VPLLIQRLPRGLSELMSIFGGVTPRDLHDSVQGGVELLQFYGMTQLQTGLAANAALAEGGTLTITPSASSWCVLFAASMTIAKTATMTALRAEIAVNRRTLQSCFLFGESLGPFGATETGNVGFGGFLAYPLLLPPGSTVNATPTVIGTDANANCNVVAEFGVLG